MATYLRYEIVTKTLKNHRFRFDHRKINEESIAKEGPATTLEPETNPSIEEIPLAANDTKGIAEKQIKKGRSFSKLSLFEESNDEENIQKKIEALINEDHYYDELLPYDYGRKYLKPQKKKIPFKTILVFVAAFIAITVLLIINLKKFI